MAEVALAVWCALLTVGLLRSNAALLALGEHVDWLTKGVVTMRDSLTEWAKREADLLGRRAACAPEGRATVTPAEFTSLMTEAAERFPPSSQAMRTCSLDALGDLEELGLPPGAKLGEHLAALRLVSWALAELVAAERKKGGQS